MTVTSIFSYRMSTGKSYLALVAKRTYRIRPGARAEPTPTSDDEPITTEPIYEDSTNPDAGHRLARDTDRFCPEKVLTDILVRGSAFSTRGPVTSLAAAVEVGPAKKQVRVVGDRKVDLQGGGKIGFTRPEAFQRMPLLWDHAFGGRDAYAEAKLSDIGTAFNRKRSGLAAYKEGMKNPKEGGWSVSYPRNIAGRGFYIDMDRERLDGAALPNLEDPADPVTPERLLIADVLDWMDLPVAACFEPIDAFTFPRTLFMLPHAANPPKRPLYELSAGALLKADLEDTRLMKVPPNPRLYNCAPAGLAVCRLSGGERVELSNLHPKHATLEFELPAQRPRLLLEPPGCPPEEMSALLQTVFIEPEEERVTLTWSGKIETAAPFPREMASAIRHAVTFGR
jgi:hypothetical protein